LPQLGSPNPTHSKIANEWGTRRVRRCAHPLAKRRREGWGTPIRMGHPKLRSHAERAGHPPYSESSFLNLLTKMATLIAMNRTPVTPSSAASMRASPLSGTMSPYPMVESVTRLK